MNDNSLIVNGLGLLLVVFGGLMFSESFVKWFVKNSNKSSGVKTKISSATLASYKTRGIFGIIIGVILIAAGTFIF